MRFSNFGSIFIHVISVLAMNNAFYFTIQ